MKKLFLGIILLSSLNAGNLTLLNKMNSRILATLFFSKDGVKGRDYIHIESGRSYTFYVDGRKDEICVTIGGRTNFRHVAFDFEEELGSNYEFDGFGIIQK
ncbi:hypothetical protein A3F66_04210 [candidate division TM6 bacterium RIFCSPHIGHO2_12_FULL_32_22]|nr:MAG: hypothetical protein A3F66_04210 [candidate division TM6 bacterium RIFCSPHIGHO2_12_FULL_32_22]